jgi:Protein of unknown function (DUF3365)
MRKRIILLTLPAALALASLATPGADTPATPATALPTIEEATARARLLHAAFDGVLRVMHRDFFRKGESKAIPSESLKDVFKTMAEENGVALRWLASEETIMNVDNKAQDEFDEKALKAVKSGGKEFSAVEKDTLRYAGVIVLQNQCLKCHVPERKTLEDRFAALEISMPVKATAKP